MPRGPNAVAPKDRAALTKSAAPKIQAETLPRTRTAAVTSAAAVAFKRFRFAWVHRSGLMTANQLRSLPRLFREDREMSVRVMGAGIGAQHIGGDPDHYEWRVSYERDGGGQYFYTVSSREAQCSRDAVEVAKRELGQHD